MKITKNTQQKLQEILQAQGYSVRYEKGTFQGGHCVVMDRKMIIINKFHSLEGKIHTLQTLLRDLELDMSLLSDTQQKWVDRVREADAVVEERES